MNFIKRLPFFILFISASLFAQDNNTSEVLTDESLKNLTYISEEKVQQGNYAIDIKKINFFNIEKKKISSQEALKLLASGDYGANLYANASNEITTALLRASTPEEKEAMRKQKEEFKVTNPSDFEGSKAKPFEMKDIDGNIYKMDDLKGKVVVLNFWFIGCAPCVQEMPELNELVAEYKEDEVVFLGIANDRKRELQSFLNKKEFDYKIIPNGSTLAMSYKIMGFPSHIVIGKDATITYGASGFGQGSVDRLAAAVKQAVAQ